MDIEVSKDNLAEIKRLRNLAIENNKESFLYGGREVLVDYAKYMIEYMEGRLV